MDNMNTLNQFRLPFFKELFNSLVSIEIHTLVFQFEINFKGLILWNWTTLLVSVLVFGFFFLIPWINNYITYMDKKIAYYKSYIFYIRVLLWESSSDEYVKACIWCINCENGEHLCFLKDICYVIL